MKEKDIVYIALENLQKHIGITGKWKDTVRPKELDGQLELKIDNFLTIKFNAEIKQELRNYQLDQIITQANRFKPLMVVAYRIFPKIKEELIKNQIAYLEGNGNIYIKQNDVMLWVDTQKTIPIEKDKGNRAFTKTGLRVLFQFLLNDQFINMSYRDIARYTEVGLGNINYILKGLKELGFLVNLNKDKYKLNNRKELLNKWMTAYEERLKPTLLIGTFRFIRENDFTNWKELQLNNNKTYWGGEPAGDLLTHHLRPAELTLYTLETKNELIKNYRLIPDERGNIKIYKKFWPSDKENVNTVPPLLIYTDLINTGEKRCIETAEKIYNELLKQNL